jgi:hypothetical protein
LFLRYNVWREFIISLLNEDVINLLWKKEEAQYDQEQKFMRIEPNYNNMHITIFEYLVTYKIYIFSNVITEDESIFLSGLSWEKIDEWI